MRVYVEISINNSKGYLNGKATGHFEGKDEDEILIKMHKIWGDNFNITHFETKED